jgi:hypothetical protein
MKDLNGAAHAMFSVSENIFNHRDLLKFEIIVMLRIHQNDEKRYGETKV